MAIQDETYQCGDIHINVCAKYVQSMCKNLNPTVGRPFLGLAKKVVKKGTTLSNQGQQLKGTTLKAHHYINNKSNKC